MAVTPGVTPVGNNLFYLVWFKFGSLAVRLETQQVTVPAYSYSFWYPNQLCHRQQPSTIEIWNTLEYLDFHLPGPSNLIVRLKIRHHNYSLPFLGIITFCGFVNLDSVSFTFCTPPRMVQYSPQGGSCSNKHIRGWHRGGVTDPRIRTKLNRIDCL